MSVLGIRNMAIKKSVGNKGSNSKTDVMVVQSALNLSQSNKFKLNQDLVVDGKSGSNTTEAIELFQKTVVRLVNTDGRVDPGGKTLAALKKSTVKGLSESALLAIMAMGQAATIKTYLSL